MNATFPKSERLCSKNCIDELFANGEARRSGGFTVKYLRSHMDETVGAENFQPLPKILISVPKRFQKRAVDRNRTKRLIREVYRKHKHLLARTPVSTLLNGMGSNIYSLAIIYASSKVPDYAFVEEHLPKLLEKIK
ncbi:MAG: ribonuclease P protein component [Bacteroidales bacterium]|nr:ribonuclease P protein component [Bacteroidales bacterium]